MNLNTDGCCLSCEALGQAIKKQRKRLAESDFGKKNYPYGFTQKDLCDCLNSMFDAQVNVKKLSRIEAGHQEPSFSLIVQIAFVLGGSYWRATLCEIVEDSLPGDEETSGITALEDAYSYSLVMDEWGHAAKRWARADRLSEQITEAAEELADMLHEMNLVLADPRNVVMRLSPAEDNQPSVLPEIIQRRAYESETSAFECGAVAIDEPEGKEHEHEQD